MNPVVAFALRQRLLIMAVLGLTILGGIAAFKVLNIEAYPDPVPPMVEVVTQSSGQSAQEIERTITIPIEVQLSGIKNVKKVETISVFGLSDVRVQFSFSYDYEQAKQQVINALSQLPPMPAGTQPQISPTSPIGEIYRYRIMAPKGYSVTDLKTIQDWILQRRFKAVPGVIDVNGWAGKSKTYDVTIDQNKLVGKGLSIGQVITALNNANGNVGGQTVNIGPQAAVVRGIGIIHSMDDIGNTMIAAPNGQPVLVKDVAHVSIGNMPRLGIVGQDNDDDIVQGVILMRRGEESMPTLKAVEAEIDKVNNGDILPPGVHLEKIYDRTDLINVTTHTVLENMVVGMVLIFAVQFVFLGNLRSAIIVAATIPFALSFAVIIMVLRGESANLLSVGAIDFGLIVDATVIMVENIFRHLAQNRHDRFASTGALDHAGGIQSFFGKLGIIEMSATEVNRAIFFAAAIIIAGFLPLFTLTGVEGHIFGPMARTYAYAIAGGLIATFTVAPVLSALLLRDQEEEKDTRIVAWMRAAYDPVIRFALANRILALGGMGALLVAAGIASHSLGLEFLPKLEEGNFWIRATLPRSVSLEEAQGYTNRMRRILMKYPEVRTVVSQLGRPDDGTDTTGFFNAEFYVPLKPQGEWPSGMTKDKLTQIVSKELEAPFPGVEFEFSQNIEDNVEEAASGVKGQNSVKIYGNDLAAIEKAAYEIKRVMGTVQGVTDMSVFDAMGQPTINIKVNREAAARYGLAPGDVNAVVSAAIGGQAAGNLYEYGSDRNFPIMVRLAPQFRQNIDAIRSIPVAVPNAGNGVTQVPLSAVADVKLVSSYSFIYRENQSRYIPVGFAVRGRDLGSAIIEAKAKIDRQVKLPPGAHLEWVGEFDELQAALTRLEIVVPLSFLVIGILLFINFGSVRDAVLAASVMPMALIGGIFALYFTNTPFSVSAAIGFIGLFGISVMGGILVLAYYNQLMRAGMEREKAVLHAARTQFRPVMMTCVAACVG
ncbi:MAG TPA: CusA/CzcA family heavy metal efflux RND transporter, partial [Novosphingobium sp.]|nr:CusA/CzcA family heavy metal efflux RND transporter [Novosphingobium sp.]